MDPRSVDSNSSVISYDRSAEVQYTPSKWKKFRYALWQPWFVTFATIVLRGTAGLIVFHIIYNRSSEYGLGPIMLSNLATFAALILFVDIVVNIVTDNYPVGFGTRPWLYVVALSFAIFGPHPSLPPEFALLSISFTAEALVYRLGYNFRVL